MQADRDEAVNPVPAAARNDARSNRPSVRAKFIVTENQPVQEGADTHNIVMRAVTESDPGQENHDFWTYTPAGELKLWTINPAAWEQLDVGQAYYLDFTRED